MPLIKYEVFPPSTVVSISEYLFFKHLQIHSFFLYRTYGLVCLLFGSSEKFKLFPPPPPPPPPLGVAKYWRVQKNGAACRLRYIPTCSPPPHHKWRISIRTTSKVVC